MKIVVMLRTLDIPQGIGIYTRNLMEAILRLDRTNKYYFIYTNNKHVGTFGTYDNLEEAVIEGRSKFIWDQVLVPRFAKRHSADIIFNTKFSIPLFTSCKTVMVFHGSEWYVYPQFYGRLDVLYNKIFQPLYCRKADAISSVSMFTAEDMARYVRFDRDKCFVVHSAAHDDFKPIEDPERIQQIKMKYKLPERYILFVGKLYPGKNFKNIVRAFKILQKETNSPLKLVSAGDLRWKFKGDIDEVERLGLLGQVLFTGWVDQKDLPVLFQGAELFLFPSLYEGFGIPIVEAFKCGCPVVTAKTGACPEIAGNAAILVDPASPQDIADGVKRVLYDPQLRAELVKKGHEEAHRFSWARSAQKTIELFNSLAGK